MLTRLLCQPSVRRTTEPTRRLLSSVKKARGRKPHNANARKPNHVERANHPGRKRGPSHKPRPLPWGKVIGAGAFVSVGALFLSAPSLEEWAEERELSVLRANGALPGDFVTISGSPDGPGRYSNGIHRVVREDQSQRANTEDASSAKEEDAADEIVVVINGNIGEASFDFASLQERVAEFATCITFDRLGYGFSDLPHSSGFAAFVREIDAVVKLDDPPSATAQLDELESPVKDLELMAEDDPVAQPKRSRRVKLVLVGQGYGALLNHEFMRRSLAESTNAETNNGESDISVVAVLALDPAVVGAKAKQMQLDPSVVEAAEAVKGQTEQLAKLARFGIARQMLRTRVNDEHLKQKYGDGYLLARTGQSRYNHRLAIANEIKFWETVEGRIADGDEDVLASLGLPVDSTEGVPEQGVENQGPVFDIPCTVLMPKKNNTFADLVNRKLVSADVAREMHRVWFEEQKRYCRQFVENRLVLVPDCGAQMHIDAQDAIVKELSNLVQAVRNQAK